MNEIISQLNNLSARWWAIIMPNSIQLIILFAILFSISYLLRKKSALLQYSIWMIFLIKAFFPIQFHFTSLSTSSVPALNYVYSTINFSDQAVNNSAVNLSLHSIIFLIWCFIIMGLITRMVHKEKQFNKLLNNSETVNLNQLLNPLKSAMDISKDVTVRTGPNVPAPFTKGLWNPVIYLPKQTLQCNHNQISAILAHELAHIKRRDIIFIYLQNLIDIIYCFHPAVWMSNKEINLHREKICDEIAIHTLQESPNNYGKTLLNNLEYLFANKNKAVISSNLFFSKKAILKRFEYLFNKKDEIMLKLKRNHYFVLFMVAIITIFLACTGVVDSNNDSKKIVSKNTRSINYDTPPKPIGGITGIQQNLQYPDAAKDNNIKGYAIVKALIDKNGNVKESKITEGDNPEINKAARKAIENTKFAPAKKGEQKIAAWVSIPVVFNPPDNSNPPNMPESEKQKFVAYDNPPKPIGGFKEIQKNIEYPQVAKEAGIEGRIIVRAYVGNIQMLVEIFYGEIQYS